MTAEAIERTRWIPVKDKLPEEDGRFLTYIVNPYNKFTYIMVCEYEFKQWWPDDDETNANVVAWMPLPEPYKEEV